MMKIYTNWQSVSRLRTLLLVLCCFGIGTSLSAQVYVQVTDSFPDLNNCSAAWGDIDNDGDMDVALSGNSSTNGSYAGIWVNNGNGTFSQLPSSNFTPSFTQIEGRTPHSLAWGDYNNDSQLDLAIVGFNGSTNYAKIWRNDGSNNFFNSFDMVPGEYNAVEWADVDNDGDQDLMLMGEANLSGGSILELNNHNQGANSFSTSTVAFPHLTRSALDFGDYDLDGDLDLVMSGYLDGNGATPTTQLWLNDGLGVFAASNVPFTGVGWGDLDWTDTDCDGDLDLMMTGFVGPGNDPRATHLFRTPGLPAPFDSAAVGMPKVGYASTSMGDYDHDGYPDLILQGDTSGQQQPANEIGTYNPSLGVFFPNNNISFPALSQGAIHWIDYDQDGDLDFFSGGLNNFAACNLFENVDTATINQPPSPPTGLSGAAVSASAIEWTWSPATDDATPSPGLSYRMIVERQSDFALLTPGFFNLSNQRQNVSQWGAIKGTSWTIRDLTPGETYCAAVVAVDAGMAASTWSATACAAAVVGIDDEAQPYTLNAWPAPATTVLNVSLEGLSGEGSLSITSLDGRVLQREAFTQIGGQQVDVSGLATGMYLLTVKMEGQSHSTTLRFLKN